MSELYLEKVHSILFEMLKEIKALCEKHNIQFFLDSGTLLGAVRHKNFIPWDDDADILMKRSEYEKFIKVADELPAPYKFVKPDEYGGYFFDFVPRIINLNEPLHTDTAEDIAQNCNQNRLAVDIFILDNAPNSEKAFKRMVFKQKMVYGQAIAHRFNKKIHSHSFIEKLQMGILGLIGKTKSLKKILKKQTSVSSAFRNQTTDFCCVTNAIVKELNRRYPKKAFESSVMLPIGNELFPCPKGFDQTLTILYGDYMTPPKEFDQVPTHVSIESAS